MCSIVYSIAVLFYGIVFVGRVSHGKQISIALLFVRVRFWMATKFYCLTSFAQKRFIFFIFLLTKFSIWNKPMDFHLAHEIPFLLRIAFVIIFFLFFFTTIYILLVCVCVDDRLARQQQSIHSFEFHSKPQQRRKIFMARNWVYGSASPEWVRKPASHTAQSDECITKKQ